MDRIEDCISFLLSKAAQGVGRQARERLQGVAVTPAQFAVLRVLWDGDGVPGAAVGARLQVDSATMTGVLDRLEGAGLVERRACGRDRRVQLVFVTEAGRAVRAEAEGAMDRLNADVARGLGGDAPAVWAALRRLAAACAVLCCLALPAAAQGFFEGRAIVTGMDERSRPQGMRDGLREVVVRVSGSPGVGLHPLLDSVDLGSLLLAFAYTDRMGTLPRQDEQGSRDRPYDLITQWDPQGIADLLRAMGAGVWPAAARPVLQVRARVEPRVGGPFVLAPDTDVDERHRAALLAAGQRFGLVVRVDPFAVPGEGAVLDGTLRWVDGAGWRAEWAVAWDGLRRRWDVDGVSFDEAYRNGVGGAVEQMEHYWRFR